MSVFVTILVAVAIGFAVLLYRNGGGKIPLNKKKNTSTPATTANAPGPWTKLALQRRRQKSTSGAMLIVAMAVMVVVGVFVFDPHNATTLVKTHWQAWVLLGFAAFSAGAGRQMEGKYNMGYIPGYVGFALAALFFLGSLVKFLD